MFVIAASIISKKVAESLDALVLDVKIGKGACMKTEKDARELANRMVRIGRVYKPKLRKPFYNALANDFKNRDALCNSALILEV